jgi:hypothetical protein
VYFFFNLKKLSTLEVRSDLENRYPFLSVGITSNSNRGSHADKKVKNLFRSIGWPDKLNELMTNYITWRPHQG